jgi:hypothetical protein
MRLLCDTIASFFASAEVFSNAENQMFSFLLKFLFLRRLRSRSIFIHLRLQTAISAQNSCAPFPSSKLFANTGLSYFGVPNKKETILPPFFVI